MFPDPDPEPLPPSDKRIRTLEEDLRKEIADHKARIDKLEARNQVLEAELAEDEDPDAPPDHDPELEPWE
jgi:hypothetical protein